MCQQRRGVLSSDQPGDRLLGQRLGAPAGTIGQAAVGQRVEDAQRRIAECGTESTSQAAGWRCAARVDDESRHGRAGLAAAHDDPAGTQRQSDQRDALNQEKPMIHRVIAEESAFGRVPVVEADCRQVRRSRHRCGGDDTAPRR